MASALFGFYFVTDRDLSVHGMIDDVRDALRAGAALVQYRDKGSAPPSADIAAEMQRLCHAAHVPLVVNDDVDLAIRIEADGVHVGQGDMPVSEVRRRIGARAIVGVSVSTVAELREAERSGATYVAASPVFSTLTKSDTGPAIGIDGVCRLRAATRLPLAVIGGLDDTNIPVLVEAGADLVCAISASLMGGTVYDNVRRMARLMLPPDGDLSGRRGKP
jgi:thiamine-phosphate pyrophosphorylase